MVSLVILEKWSSTDVYCRYWAAGLPAEASVSGYTFLMTLLFFLFTASWGQWICAFAPNFTVISNVLPFFVCQTSVPFISVLLT